MARAGVWWLAAAILAVESAAGCKVFVSCRPTRDPNCIGGEMSIVWTGDRCTWVHGAGKGEGCWRSLNECNAEHASCPDMAMFRCGDDWCYKTNQMCGAFADGRRRCVASLTVPPSCDGLGSTAARCTTEGGGIHVKIGRELPCGYLQPRCAAGLEVCEITASRAGPNATCVANTAQSRKDCGLLASCRSLGDDYLVKPEAQDLGADFPCGTERTCWRHTEICVFSKARGGYFTEPGRCVRGEFPDCLASGFDHCLTDTFGAEYVFH